MNVYSGPGLSSWWTSISIMLTSMFFLGEDASPRYSVFGTPASKAQHVLVTSYMQVFFYAVTLKGINST